MTLPAAAAIAAIWIGVGIAAWGAPSAVARISIDAFFATLAVCIIQKH